MVQAIGSSAAGNGGGTQSSAGLLNAQLNRYQTQLADWCNCPSGKTPAGKAKIQEIQDKADAVKAQLKRLAADKTAADKPQRPPAVDQGNANPVSGVGTDTAPQGGKATPSAGRASLVGGFLDVFA